MTTLFSEFSLDRDVLLALEKMGYDSPSYIQKEAIPLILQGSDLIGLAETGSGKTAACAIPICHKVNTSKNELQALILVPTRELAHQYLLEMHKIGKIKGVKAFAIYGGEDFSVQRAKLKSGVHVLIATCGRLIDFIYQKEIDLSSVHTLVLDEADEMLSLGFFEDMTFIMNCLMQAHQTLLFSATMPKDVEKLVQSYLVDPKKISLPQEKRTPKRIKHHLINCRAHEKQNVLLSLLNEENLNQCLVFTSSRNQCEDLFSFLKTKIAKVDFLHGGLNQQLRSSITQKFRDQKIKVMVATDVAARGLDFSGVTHVINYTLGFDPDQYIHRVGRCGRWDKEGAAFTFVSKKDLGVLFKIKQRLDQEFFWEGDPLPLEKATRNRKEVSLRGR